MAKSNSLGRAKDAKQDEFYTQLADIENELRHYRPHFKGKTVLCNCDDPYESNFFKYFALNFNKLKLKKLIATCYSGSPITGTQLSLFGDETEDGRRTPYKAVVTTVHDTTGETEKVKLAYWTAYREVAGGHPEFLKEFSPQKPSKDHWSTLRLGVSAYHLALLIDTHKGRTGIELYVDDDKEIGHRAIANSGIFEEHLGLTAAPFDAKKASGLRFYKAGHPIKGHQDAWPGYIEEQLGWALEMKKIIAEIEL